MAARRALILALGSLACAAAVTCDVCAGGDTLWETQYTITVASACTIGLTFIGYKSDVPLHAVGDAPPPHHRAHRAIGDVACKNNV